LGIDFDALLRTSAMNAISGFRNRLDGGRVEGDVKTVAFRHLRRSIGSSALEL
jgi:hypothetical protein